MTKQTNILPMLYIPQKVTNAAILTYIAALVVCVLVYKNQMLELRWVLFGLIEVLGFFCFSNYYSKKWAYVKSKVFVKNVFLWGFTIRVVWVLISYWLYYNWTGTPFSIGAADELFYDQMGRYGAKQLRNGIINLYASFVVDAPDVTFSDMGYPIYLSIIYYIFFDSILMARIVKAIWGAWTAVLIYKLAARNFGEQAGRLAGVICMLMPVMIYYCSFQLKEVEMVFLVVLFAERADVLLRMKKIRWIAFILLMLIPAYLFMFRTVLAATLVLAFMCALLLTTGRVVNIQRRIGLSVVAVVAALVMLFSSSSIGEDVFLMLEIGGSGQQANMEWRAERDDMAGGLNQSFAKYAGAAVFAPMIFTIPFPTMSEVPGQENQKMIHGGNFVKNILSFFTIIAIILLLVSGDWRKHVLPLAILCGYLVVLVFSTFAHSERFHQPIVPFMLMFVAYGINKMNEVLWIRKWYPWWCVLMFIAAIAWNWFKLAGRGMI